MSHGERHSGQHSGEHEDHPSDHRVTGYHSSVGERILHVRQHAAHMMRTIRAIMMALLLSASRRLRLARVARTAWARIDERWLRHHRERMFAYLADRVAGARTDFERWAQSHWDRLVNRYGKRKAQQIAIVTLLVVTVICGPLSVLATVGIFHSFAQPSSGKPNIIDPATGTHSTIHLPPQPARPNVPTLTSRPPMPHVASPTMQPGSITLDSAHDTQFVGSDGRFEVDVPAGR